MGTCMDGDMCRDMDIGTWTWGHDHDASYWSNFSEHSKGSSWKMSACSRVPCCEGLGFGAATYELV
eukprot:5392340-Prymnesium_polylepis.2